MSDRDEKLGEAAELLDQIKEGNESLGEAMLLSDAGGENAKKLRAMMGKIMDVAKDDLKSK